MFLTFLEWLRSTALAKAIIEMRWSMPIFLTFHAIGMTLLIGTIIIVSLRLLGLLMPRRPVPEIAEELWRWSLLGIAIMLTSGLLLFFPETLRWYHSGAFRVKMAFLFTAILFHFTIYRKITQGNEVSSFTYRLCGVLTLLLWCGVGFGGRALTFE